jgi:RNA polymerase sigma factor (TIGR02999 family)
MPEPTTNSDELRGLPLSYDDLRDLAQRILRRWVGQKRLGRTSLVHETFLRLTGALQGRDQDQQHWLAIAARAMRFVLVDAARRATTDKRRDGAHEHPLRADDATAAALSPRLLALGEALGDLAAIDPRRARIVELRAFGGLTVDECAATLGISPATVHREWPLAKAWLFRRIQSDQS